MGAAYIMHGDFIVGIQPFIYLLRTYSFNRYHLVSICTLLDEL